MEEPERLSDDLIHGFVDYLSFNGKIFNWQDETSDVGRKRLEAHDQVDFAIFLDEATARDAIPRIVALLDDNVLGEFGSGLLSDWIHGDPANRLPWLTDVATRDPRLGIALRAAHE